MLEWAEGTFVKLKIQAWHWNLIWLVMIKLRNFHILNVLWQSMKEQTLLCICSCICHWHFMPDRAIYYFLMSSNINVVLMLWHTHAQPHINYTHIDTYTRHTYAQRYTHGTTDTQWLSIHFYHTKMHPIDFEPLLPICYSLSHSHSAINPIDWLIDRLVD